MEIPVICRFCGKEGGIHEYGEIYVGSFDAWKNAKVYWSTAHNKLIADVSDQVEWDDPGIFELEDEYRAFGFACSHCGKTDKHLYEIAEPKYGLDSWGCVLDADGNPHGPMEVSPNQMQMELEAE